ncbi:MAG: bifunctional hydroxymethylpyrimidine kinase/phosphomethylpyrimidine kinase [Thermoplasmata archaeon]|nr:bifunctional hydroxymethylpyrimidine kinase/phosphomethylpyrimidine kinase [Thermoplasmata archaeon]
MPSVLCIAGLDPSGYAGLSADLRALAYLDLHAQPVVSTLTVQNLHSFSEFQPVPPDLIAKQLKTIMEERNPDAIKVGVLGSAEIARIVADFMDGCGIPSVVDPVFASTTGFSFIDDEIAEIYIHDILSVCSLVTPNAHEASILSGINVTDPETAKVAAGLILDMGARGVLIKGGHFKSQVGTDIFCDSDGIRMLPSPVIEHKSRGTGCTYSALIAGHLSRGFNLWDSVRTAKDDISRVLDRCSIKTSLEETDLPSELAQAREELNMAVSRILRIMPAEYIAEVGNNIAYATEDAKTPDQICSLDSRFILKGNRVATLGTPVFGRRSHVGRVVLAAMAKDRSVRCAMNLKYSEDLIVRFRDVGFTVGSFDRQEEPESSSTMEWGTGKAINDLGYVPDAVFDLVL